MPLSTARTSAVLNSIWAHNRLAAALFWAKLFAAVCDSKIGPAHLGMIGVTIMKTGSFAGHRGIRLTLGRNLLAAVFAVTLTLGALTATQAMAESYRIMSGDTLKIDVFLSPEHSAETKVDDNGQISLPAVGRIHASGLTLEEIETSIVDKLTKLSDISSVRVTASVSEYRPVFVIGLVNTPGRFPYVSRTTVLQALALAGGIGNPLYRRSAQANNPADLVDRQERFDVATLQFWSAMARRTRLLAEQSGAAAIEFPADFVAKLSAAGEQGALEREKEIFSARLQTMANSLEIIKAQKVIVRQEIESAKSYAVEVSQSVPAMQKELENLTSLRDKGLTRRLEVLTVQRQVSDMQRETRASDLSIARSQRELNDLDKQESNLKGLRLAEVAQALVDTETEIATLKARLDNQARLLPAGSNLSAAPGATENPAETPVAFEIVRLNADGVANSVSANEDTLLVPGDVLKVIAAPSAAAVPPVSN